MQLWNLQSNEKTLANRKQGFTPVGSDPKDLLLQIVIGRHKEY